MTEKDHQKSECDYGRNNMIIRRASTEEMLKLWRYEKTEHISPTAGFFYQNISAGNAVFWTVDHAGELIGELYVFLDLEDRDFANGNDTAYLCAFRVKKEFRGHGLGTMMMNTALQELKDLGFSRATIGVSKDEEDNLRLYRRMGFTETVRECHYDPCGLDENGRPEYDEDSWWLLAKDLK